MTLVFACIYAVHTNMIQYGEIIHVFERIHEP